MFILLSIDVLILQLCSASKNGEEFNSLIANSQIIFTKPYHSHKKTEEVNQSWINSIQHTKKV